MRLRRLLALVLAGNLTTALAPAQAAPDQTLGMALMAANVGQTGTLHRGIGAVSATKVSNGTYRVVFNREVLGKCIYVANSEPGPSLGGGFVKVQETVSDANAVLVYTSNSNNVPENSHFELIVLCAQ